MVTEFLRGLIDYAGLFPPAKLDLETTLSNYLAYRESKWSHLLGKLVLPAHLLSEASNLYTGTDILAASLIAKNLTDELPEIRKTLNRNENQIQIAAVETTIAPSLDDPSDFVVSTLSAATAISSNATVFFEVMIGDNWQALLTSHLELLSSKQNAAFKLRCGGTQLPSVTELAQAIVACRDASVPIKFTAGLHHPIRSREQHGFINVFFTSLCAHAHTLDQSEVEQMLSCETTDTLEQNSKGIRWQGRELSVEQIISLRNQFVISFGSCSFDEPVNDLVALGWLHD